MKFFLSDFGSTHRIIELYGSINGAEYFSVREDTISVVPDSWKRQKTLKIRAEDVLIIGSGGSSKVTDAAITECRKVGAKAIVLVDSWVNYLGRFSIPPSEILVTDPWARDYAKICWPNTPVNMKIIDRTHLSIKHSGKISRIVIVGTPTNSFTEDHLERHHFDGSCLCPEIRLATTLYENCDLVIRPHPNSENICSFTNLEEATFVKSAKQVNDLSPHSILIGRPSYAHYYFESMGVPAYFTERVNHLWKGPLFRLCT